MAKRINTIDRRTTASAKSKIRYSRLIRMVQSIFELPNWQSPRNNTNHFRRTLLLEPLEDRMLLAGVTVDTITDTSNDGETTSITALVADRGSDNAISLREAITAANNTPGADTIGFDTAGVFATPQTITLNGSQLPKIIGDVTINGPGAANLTIDANNTSRIFQINDSNSSNEIAVEIVGMTLTGGQAIRGGGINSRESLTLRDSVVSGNTASGSSALAGGIYNGFGTLSVTNSIISGNATNTVGGGIFNRGTLSVTNSSVSGNYAAIGGGGVFNIGTTTVSNSTVSGNSLSLGQGNLSGGGAFYNGGNLTVLNSTVSGNSADYGGGFMSSDIVFYDAFLSVTNSTISGNSAPFGFGGGILALGFDSTVKVTNSTISGNTACCGGGAIFGYGYNIYFGKYYWYGTLEINNTIIAGNSGDDLGGSFNSFTGSNNLSDSPIIPGIPVTNFDTNLADNGGPTLTHALLTGSNAIDAGSNALAVDSGGSPLTTDQRGFEPRNFGGTVDIGAFEFGAVGTSSNAPPSITSDGGGETASVDVAENQTAVTDVEATDDSDSEGAGLVYSLSGADMSSFTIDENTGELAFTTAPDFENPTDDGFDNVYDVQVIVTDAGGLTDTQDIAVTVTDVDAVDETSAVVGDVQTEIGILVNDPLLSSKAQSTLTKAQDNLNDALAQLAQGDVKKGLQEVGKAVDDLLKAQDEGADVAHLIAQLVETARAIAQDAIDAAVDAGGDPKDIGKAQDEMAKAQVDLDSDKPDKAIAHFAKAWDKAQKAI